MISAQLQEALIAEARPRHVIDADWIKGIRKSWKLALGKARRYPNRIERSDDIDLNKIYRSADGAIGALNELIGYVRSLRADLLLNKGFWTTKMDTRSMPGLDVDFDALRAKVVANLDKAEDAASGAKRKVTYWKDALTPGTGSYQLDGGNRHRDAQASYSGFQLYVNSVFLSVEEGADLANRAVNLMLDNLSDAMKKAPHTFSLIGSKGRSEPDVVRLGKVTVMFADAPAAGERPMRRSFDHLGSSEVMLPLLPTVDGAARQPPRHPSLRRSYIDQLKKAEALLRHRGLGFLWYGDIVVMCQECGGPNQYGPKWTTGGHYHRKGDRITLYDEAHSNLYRLVAHEMGHRYYYKFMSNQDRANFNRFFGGYPISPPPGPPLPDKVAPGKVRATSEYGGVSTEEDFAEVFRDYIDGRNLDRDQVERLRQFLKGDRKLEWRESP